MIRVRYVLSASSEINYFKPGSEHLGSSKKVKIVSVLQVSSLLPLLLYSELEQVTSTTVPVFTGNCVVVSIAMLIQSVLSPVQ